MPTMLARSRVPSRRVWVSVILERLKGRQAERAKNRKSEVITMREKSGFRIRDPAISPCASCTSERVVPHEGQGIPVTARNTQGGRISWTGTTLAKTRATMAIVPKIIPNSICPEVLC